MTLTIGDVVGPYMIDRVVRDTQQYSLYEATRNLGSAGTVRVLLKQGEGTSNEAVTLATLRKTATDDRLLPYLPQLMDTVVHDGEFFNVFKIEEGFYSLREVHDAYPNGIDPRDMAWMYRRLLVVLGFVHQLGTVHCAVLPHAVLIHPEKHGLILTDWQSAVTIPEDDLVLPKVEPVHEFAGFYPQDEIVSGDLDIYMAAYLMKWLCVDIEPSWQKFFEGSLHYAPMKRIHNAWKVLELLDHHLERLYGKRKYREFVMP